MIGQIRGREARSWMAEGRRQFRKWSEKRGNGPAETKGTEDRKERDGDVKKWDYSRETHRQFVLSLRTRLLLVYIFAPVKTTPVSGRVLERAHKCAFREMVMLRKRHYPPSGLALFALSVANVSPYLKS